MPSTAFIQVGRRSSRLVITRWCIRSEQWAATGIHTCEPVGTDSQDESRTKEFNCAEEGGDALEGDAGFADHRGVSGAMRLEGCGREAHSPKGQKGNSAKK